MNYKEMNELSVNNPKLLSSSNNMKVGASVRKALRKRFFDVNTADEDKAAATQIRQLARDGDMSENDYYLMLKQLRSEERYEASKLRNNEIARMRRLLNRLHEGTIDQFQVDLDRLGGNEAALNLFIEKMSLTEGNIIVSALQDDGEVYRVWTYNDRMRGVFRQLIAGTQFTEIANTQESDAEILDIIKNFSKLKIERVRLPKGVLLIDDDEEDEEGQSNSKGKKPYQKNQGGFFKYYHNLPGIDLRRYNIFSSKDEADYEDNCFLVALRSGGASDEVLQIVRTKMRNRYIKMGDIKHLCSEANILVEVKVRTIKPVKEGEKQKVSCGKLKNNIYGDTGLSGVEGKHFKLAIIDDHFILNEPLPFKISNYCLNHYEEMKDNLPTNYEKRENNKTARAKELCKDSFKLIERLLDDRDIFLTRIPRADLLDTQYYDQNINIKTLTFGNENYESMEDRLDTIVERYKELEEDDVCNIFIDFETNTRARYVKKSVNENGDIVKIDKGIRHIAYLGSMLATFQEKGKLVKDPVKTFYTQPDGVMEYNGNKVIVKGDAGKQMIKHIANTYGHFKNINLIAHNCGYDMRVGLYPYIYNLELIENGHSLIVGSGNIYGSKGNGKIPVKLKCSYRMIGQPLGKFGKVFDIPQEKEYMPYELYTTKNIKKRWIWYEKNDKYPNEDYCMRYVKEADRETFINNCNKWGLYSTYGKNKNKIDILRYSARYCEMDCIVLQKGYELFREQIKTISKQVIKKDYYEKYDCPNLCVDIYNQYTISSVANELMLLGGCYEGTYRIAGVLREFIQKCVVGGRVMCCDNKKVKVVGGVSYNKYTQKKEYIQDFDGVSLYPSSLVRIPGFIKGLPKILPSFEDLSTRDEMMTRLNEISNNSHYFLEINITRVGIKRQFPLMSCYDGLTREWTNDVLYKPDGTPWSMYVDKTMLEDWIKFHDIDFKVVRGYYFTDGYNPAINETMKFLFEERLRAKKEGNSIQSTLKLCLNSGYGKTLEKAHEEKIKYLEERHREKYIHRNYNFIKDLTPTADGRWKLREWNTIDKHFNQVHQGVSVLSMSKRIMNEVMCLAEDKGYGMFYTDTDSIHMFSECVNLLADDWGKMYGGKDGRPDKLIGEYLGQFHNDFDLKGADGKTIQSIKFIALGKKCYLDILEGVSKDTGEKIYGFHIRMKGVSGNAVEYQASEIQRQMNLLTKEDGAWEMYNKMFNDESMTFDLCKNADGSEKLCFKFFNDFTIGNMNDEYVEKDGEKKFGFTRTTQFLGQGKLQNNDFKNILQ